MNQEFNISKALAKKEATTRDGRKANQLVLLDAPKDPYPIVGVVEGIVQTWTVCGRSVNDKILESLDLFTPEEDD